MHLRVKYNCRCIKWELGSWLPFLLNLFVEEKNIDLRGICPIFLERLTTFVFELDRYISSQNYSQIINWVRSPFEVSAVEVQLQMDCIAEKLIKQQSRQMRRDKLKTVSLTQFWASAQSIEPNLSDLGQPAAVALLPFSTTFLCKAGFSTLALVKTKQQTATES